MSGKDIGLMVYLMLKSSFMAVSTTWFDLLVLGSWSKRMQ